MDEPKADTERSSRMPFWQAVVSDAALVVGDEPYPGGPWTKDLRLRCTVASSVDSSIGNVPRRSHKHERPLLAISAHHQFAGLWEVDRVSGAVVYCLVRPFDGEAFPAPLFDVIWGDTEPGSNLCAVALGTVEGPPRARFAPPLRLHMRCTIFMVDAIDTVNQTFRADVHLEARARAVATSASQDVVDSLFNAYDLKPSLLGFLNVTELTGDLEQWTSFSSSVYGHDKVDYSVKMRARAVFTEQYELENFPFDEQELTLSSTVAVPSSRVQFLENEEYPSLFLAQSFQLGALFSVALGNHVLVRPGMSDPAESSAGITYPRCRFTLVLHRKYGYFLINVIIPVGSVTLIAPLTASTEADGVRMGTGDRLAYALTLLLTAVAYKFVIASSIPPVSYLVSVEEYTLVCFGFMWLNLLETALWPSLIGYTSSGEERFSEWWWAVVFLGLFAMYNIYYARKVGAMLVARKRCRTQDLLRLNSRLEAQDGHASRPKPQGSSTA